MNLNQRVYRDAGLTDRQARQRLYSSGQVLKREGPYDWKIIIIDGIRYKFPISVPERIASTNIHSYDYASEAARTRIREAMKSK